MSDVSFSIAYGCTVAKLRERADLSQAVLAARTDMTQSRISRLENGAKSALPDVEQAAKLARALGTTSADLERIALKASADVSAFRHPKFVDTAAASDKPAWNAFLVGLTTLAVVAAIGALLDSKSKK